MAQNAGDELDPGGDLLGVLNYWMMYDDDGYYNQARSNLQKSILTLAPRTSSTNSPTQTNYNARGVRIFLNVTSITDTPSIALIIQEMIPNTAIWVDILKGAAVTGTGTYIYDLYPGADVTGSGIDKAVSLPLGLKWRVRVEHADADSIQYEVGGHVIM